MDADACRRLVAALLLQSLKDRVSRVLDTRVDAQRFIGSPRAFELAALIDHPWPPTDAMLINFASDPTLCLSAFRTA
jgi:hypothetical protein